MLFFHLICSLVLFGRLQKQISLILLLVSAVCCTQLHPLQLTWFTTPSSFPVLCVFFSSLRLTASPQEGSAFHVTATRLVPSRSIVMRLVSVGVSQVSPDQSVTAVHEGFSTSRRAAAHVSVDCKAKDILFVWVEVVVLVHQFLLQIRIFFAKKGDRERVMIK